MENPIFRKIVSTDYYTPRQWKNKNKLLTRYADCIGVKTGYTKEAGRCLVSAAKKGEMTLICTVLQCGPMYERSQQLLEEAFSTYHNEPILKDGDTLVIKENNKTVLGRVRDTFHYPLAEGEESQIEIFTKAKKEKNNKEIIGEFDIYLSKRLLFSGKLYKL